MSGRLAVWLSGRARHAIDSTRASTLLTPPTPPTPPTLARHFDTSTLDTLDTSTRSERLSCQDRLRHSADTPDTSTLVSIDTHSTPTRHSLDTPPTPSTPSTPRHTRAQVRATRERVHERERGRDGPRGRGATTCARGAPAQRQSRHTLRARVSQSERHKGSGTCMSRASESQCEREPCLPARCLIHRRSEQALPHGRVGLTSRGSRSLS